jgi:FG-GAP repeat
MRLYRQVNVWIAGGSNNMANPGHQWHAEAARDFNGDGKADILWQDDGADGGSPAIWLMNGTSFIAGRGCRAPSTDLARRGERRLQWRLQGRHSLAEQ